MRHVAAPELERDMTLVIGGQNHIVERVSIDDEVWVEAETVVGDMGPKTFRFELGDRVMVLS